MTEGEKALKRLRELQAQRVALQRQHAAQDAARQAHADAWRKRTARRGDGKVRLPNGQ